MEKRIIFSEESMENYFGYMMSNDRCQGHKTQPKGGSGTGPHECTHALTDRLPISALACLQSLPVSHV